MKIKYYVAICVLLTIVSNALSSNAQVITTVAGNGTAGYRPDGVLADTAAIDLRDLGAGSFPSIAFDASGNMYFTESANQVVRKVNSSGIMTTIAGQHGIASYNGDGIPASNATLNNPAGLVFDAAGNLYIADYGNARIRMINSSGTISTIAGGGATSPGDGGAATSAVLCYPAGITIDASGNIFFADVCDYVVRKVSTGGIISLVAGTYSFGFGADNIPATTSQLDRPRGVAVDGSGNVYVAEGRNNRVRKINNAGVITTVAGNGNNSPMSGDTSTAVGSVVSDPMGLAIDTWGDLFIAEYYFNRIRELSTSGSIKTVAGNGTIGYNGDGGQAIHSELYDPYSTALNSNGDLFIADAGNNRIRKVNLGLAGIKNINSDISGIDITPNPNNGTFTFSIVSGIDEQASVTVTNMVGEKVKELTVTTNRQVNVNLSMPPGIYILSAGAGDGRYVTKVVVR